MGLLPPGGSTSPSTPKATASVPPHLQERSRMKSRPQQPEDAEWSLASTSTSCRCEGRCVRAEGKSEQRRKRGRGDGRAFLWSRLNTCSILKQNRQSHQLQHDNWVSGSAPLLTAIFEASFGPNGFAGGVPLICHEGQVQIWRFVQVFARHLASPAAGSGQSRIGRTRRRAWRMRCGRK
jgi:hypothetical protein